MKAPTFRVDIDTAEAQAVMDRLRAQLAADGGNGSPAAWWQGQTWAMEPEALAAIIDTDVDPSAFFGIDLEAASQLTHTVKDGVAEIAITGPIATRASFFTMLFGGTTYSAIVAAVEAADADMFAESIRLVIDSPGGAVDGAHEAAQAIAGTEKPTQALITGLGASAAYWLASAADSIASTPTGRVGSIGIMMSVMDRSAPRGRVVHDFRSSQSPRKNPDPASTQGQADIQTMLDDLAAVFIADVAKGRGVDAKTVAADFGQGAVLVGERALQAGMIDSIQAPVSAPTTEQPQTAQNATAPAAETGEQMDTPTIDAPALPEAGGRVAELEAQLATSEAAASAAVKANGELTQAVNELKATVETMQATAHAAERTHVLTAAVKAGAITPAEAGPEGFALKAYEAGLWPELIAHRKDNPAVPLGQISHGGKAPALTAEQKKEAAGIAANEALKAKMAEGHDQATALRLVAAEGALT